VSHLIGRSDILVVVPSFSSLQACVTPRDVMKMVGHQIGNTTDPALSRLILVPLSKQLISIDNDYYHSANMTESALIEFFGSFDDVKALGSVVKHFSHAIKAVLVSGTDREPDKKQLNRLYKFPPQQWLGYCINGWQRTAH
jgi:hypothetical protein